MTVRRLFQLCAWLSATLIGVLSLVAPALRPVTMLPHNLEHAAIFAIAGFAAGRGYPDRPLRTHVAFVTFAGAIELAQLFVPGRHARISDFVIDGAAACAGILVARFAAGLRPARRGRLDAARAPTP